ncbi:MAG: cytochrome c nitrite reductase small subunit [Vicinamibacterales bacterium]
MARYSLIALASAIGIVIGLGTYTFVYARGASYLSNDPDTCRNCHVMREQFDAWMKSSHASVAVCNDCHTPHRLVPKYATKALNGFWHSFAFTTGWFPDAIRITERNRSVTDNSCSTCHADAVAAMPVATGDSTECLKCHRSVGHLH